MTTQEHLNAIKEAALEFWIDYNYEVAQGRKEGEEWLDEEDEEDEECDKCGNESVLWCMSDGCRDLEEEYCFKDTTIDTVENDICFCSVGGCVKPDFEKPAGSCWKPLASDCDCGCDKCYAEEFPEQKEEEEEEVVDIGCVESELDNILYQENLDWSFDKPLKAYQTIYIIRREEEEESYDGVMMPKYVDGREVIAYGGVGIKDVDCPIKPTTPFIPKKWSITEKQQEVVVQCWSCSEIYMGRQSRNDCISMVGDYWVENEKCYECCKKEEE